MTLIPENITSTVKAADMPAIAAPYVRLRRRGHEYVCLCPFHSERTPSCTFYRDPRTSEWHYKCFGCGASGDVIDFIQQIEGKSFREAVGHLAAMVGLTIEDGGSWTDQPMRLQLPKPEPRPVTYIPEETVSGYLAGYRQNNLYAFFASQIGVERADEIFQRYGVGSTADGRAVFIQRDINGMVRQVKLIPYNDPHTGKRDRRGGTEFIGKRLAGLASNLVQCFFGEHLLHLPENAGKPTAIVESEKTAMLADLYCPGRFVWLATGGSSGCSMVNPEVNHVLHGKTVHLFPDQDKAGEWKEDAFQMRSAGITIYVNETVTQYAGEKEDIGDLIVASWLMSGPDTPQPQAPSPGAALKLAPAAPVPPDPVREVGAFEMTAVTHKATPGPVQGAPPAIWTTPAVDPARFKAPASKEPAHDWKAEIGALESFFRDTVIPTCPIRLSAVQTIENPSTFISSHLVMVRANNGKPRFRPYLSRLIQLKHKIEQDETNMVA